MKCPTCKTEFQPQPPKIRAIALYDDNSEDDVMLLDEGQDIDALLREWVRLDDELCATGCDPEDWLPFSEFMRSKGVMVIDHKVDSIGNFREDKP